jgi:plastocyanin
MSITSAHRAQPPGRPSGRRLVHVAATAAVVGLVAVGLAMVAAAAPTPLQPGRLRVRVTLRDAAGRVAPVTDAVVWLPGVEPASAVSRGPSSPRIAQRGKRFEPRIEVVRTGTEVAFPNYDRVFHNVFSFSEVARFDLGLYRNGASRAVRFDRPGVARIYCNIHPQMTAFMVVVDSGLFVRTSSDGVAELDDVPSGRHAVRVWHERADESERTVVVAGGALADAAVALDGSSWRFVQHLNKYGRTYPPPNDDDNRY